MGFGNTGAGQNVMELIYQQCLCQRTDGCISGFFVLSNCLMHGQVLQIMQGDLSLSHIALDLTLVGQGTAVQLQIQLTRIGAGTLHSSFQLLHKLAYRSMTGTG